MQRHKTKLRKRSKVGSFKILQSFQTELNGRKCHYAEGMVHTTPFGDDKFWDEVVKWADEGKVEIMHEPSSDMKEKTNEAS